jgi:UDP-N-acetylglucosamine diphosphorylase/glucosamine-1-phosphate N-acetyltransferase
MSYILFDDQHIRLSLLPLTFTRPISEIRIGVLKITEKWERLLQRSVSHVTESYLQEKYPQRQSANDTLINGAVCPDEDLVKAVVGLKTGEKLMSGEILVAYKPESIPTDLTDISQIPTIKILDYEAPITIIRQLTDIFVYNGDQIRADFARLTKGRTSAPITDPYTYVYNPEQVFLEEGADIKASVLNAEKGPIYISKNAQSQEGSVIRGPFVLGESSIVSMGSKMRGDITIGPFCKLGGEVSNSVVFGHSNKGHEGYLGNSVLGEWCNLGADTNTSNMKNDYGIVKQWNYAEETFKETGRQFVGLVMGDHSKAGINTMFNTGSVVGVSANIFGGDFPPNFVPSFSWGGAKGLEIYQLDKALEVANRAMERRELSLSEIDRNILTAIFHLTHSHRKPIGFRAGF